MICANCGKVLANTSQRICALNKKPVRVYQQVAVVNPVVKTEVKYG